MSSLFPEPQYAHLKLVRVGDQAPRRKQPGHGGYPPRDPIAQGAQLNAAVQGILSDRNARKQPAGIDPKLILRVRLSPKSHIDEDTWRRSGFTVIGSQSDNVTLLFANDTALNRFRDNVSQYAVGPSGAKSTQHAPWVAAIESIAEWGPADRRGRSLRTADLGDLTELIVDVELWYPGSLERSRDLISELQQFIESKGGGLLDRYTGRALVLARVRIPAATLDDLLALDMVYRVEAPPKPDFSLFDARNLSVSDLPPVMAPPADAASVCILDSGIAAGHFLLAPAVGETIAVPISLGTSADVNGHGTMVGGIALYGNVQERIENKSFQPEHWLFSARLTNERAEFNEDAVIPRLMDDAISYFHTNHRCRVFNISLGASDQPFDGSRISVWAATLDEIAKRLDVVIVVSAGNYNILLANEGATEHALPWGNYPHTLFTEQARISSPAEAANVLTVGAITRPGAPNFGVRYPNDTRYQVAARADEPSPFTRTGPGIRGAIKPELCEVGGNLSLEVNTKSLNRRDPGIACISLNNNFVQGSLFACDSGTSFAAPHIAHDAAMILDRYPAFSANLVRALLASSATVPQAVEALFSSDCSRIQQICGYGRPNLESALISTDQHVVLLTEEQLGADQFHIFEIPLPEPFRNTIGQRYIGITLAFDPPTRYTRLDYTGTTMDYHLIRGHTLEEVRHKYENRLPNESDESKISDGDNPHMEPGAQARQWSTLQHATLSMKQNPKARYGDTYYVVVRCKRGWAGDEYYPQKYALVVTLEHTHPGIQLYETIRERTREVERVQLRNRS